MSNISFNPGEENFSNLLNSNVYVDKTEIILNLNILIDTNNNAICVSCPSGFGKTYTVNMLTAYYCNTDKKITIFDDKNISKKENWDKYLGKFNVIILNMDYFFTDKSIKNGIKAIKKLILIEIKRSISNFECTDENNFSQILYDIYFETKKKIVLIIDDWDYVFQSNTFDKESIEEYKNFLKKLINNNSLALIYITGILPMLESEYKISDNYSMISPEWMAKYFGFNENEIEELLKKKFGSEMHDNTNKEKIKKIKLDDGLNGSYEKKLNEKQLLYDEKLIHKNEIKLNLKDIKNWYNGYQLIDNIYGKKYNIYSSYSVVKAIMKKKIHCFQNKSILHSVIEKNFYHLKDIIILLMNSKRIKINVTSFESDMTIFNNKDDILTLFVHYGFLGYDSNTKEVYIPNEEVRINFEKFIISEKWKILNTKRDIFNPDEENFENMLNSKYYVDKTESILYLNKKVNTKEKYICDSRPAGFGKTTTAEMISAYYSFKEIRKSIFNNKKISKSENQNWDKYLGNFNVIKLNMKKFFDNGVSINDGLDAIKKGIIEEVKIVLPEFKFTDENEIVKIFNDIKNHTSRKIVLIIDNYDYVLRKSNKINNIKQDDYLVYLQFLNILVSDKSYLALVYMTGILPIKKYSDQSELNNFNEYSMISPFGLEKYFGFLEDEVKELCRKFNIPVEQNNSYRNNNELLNDREKKMNFNIIKSWYGGYKLIDSENNYDVYKPWSIIKAIEDKTISNYCDELSTIESITKYIEINLFGLKDIIFLLMNSKKIKINVTSFKSDMIIFKNKDDILTLFVHYGFLGYDSNTKEVYIPNEEQRINFKNFIKSEKWKILNTKRDIFNPDEENFENMLNSKYYVDKTESILYLNKKVNTKEKYICDSRPAGFGKTTTAEMISAYYSFKEIRKSIFNNKKISKSENQNWDKYLGNFNVIKLNMKKFFDNGVSINDGLDAIKKGIIEEVKIVLPEFKFTDENEIVKIFNDIKNHTSRKIVLIIDNYDYVLRKSNKINNIKQDDYLVYLQFLNILVSDKSYLALVYMTGILPIKKYSDQSELNNFNEYSMISPFGLAKYFGFLEDEVKELCRKFNIPVEQNDTYRNNNELLNDRENEMNFNNIKNRYDGYKLTDGENNYNVYTPWSIIKAIEHKSIENYWNNSSTIESITKYIEINLFGLKDIIFLLMNSKKIKINVTSFKSDMIIFKNKDDILTLFVHYGFLGYDSNTKEVYIPNEEQRINFENFIKSEKWDILNTKRRIFNPDEESFDNLLNSKYYVDKTDSILFLNEKVNTKGRYICVSRPRRFGKTTTAEMISAYYGFKEIRTSIFNNKKISKNKNQNWDTYLGKFNVIKLNMIDFFRNVESINDGYDKIKKGIIKEVKIVLPEFKFTDENEIVEIFKDIENNTGRKIVLIIDEYDYVLRKSNIYNNIKQDDYLYFLQFLNVLIKDNSYLALVYMTGILPIKKYSDQSELNNFNEYSMISPFGLAKYFGFLEDEVKELCRKFNIPVEQNDTYRNNNELLNDRENEMNFNNIKNRYDGYKLTDGENNYNVYTPWSIIKAIEHKSIENYWNNSSTTESITPYIEMNFYGLKEDILRLVKENKKIKINVTSFKNDMKDFKSKDDVFTMLVHLGYLGYDQITNEVFIPNKEIQNDFLNITKSVVWDAIAEKLKKI
ncbi:hypothetical protein BCR32DRAFT_37427 [Anaeromyces robustus]|uniref:AAA-ATPase-like domain-containing protein n=1 Tax=Anaeromyces robustus TaxID=1754192 RepID=A0A1Y1X0N0_9FUNG|nr:hypothetical protein BCR32DRAFT_37427 [Anaeromyces robustus]|eukprot:ORX79272.1 hypothetical protein BCR32DRAFT_37427 [Anaeromyces robustus]